MFNPVDFKTFELDPKFTEKLFEEGEVEQIEEWLENWTDDSIKEGIKTIISFDGTINCLVALYYKWLTQLHTMYSINSKAISEDNKQTKSSKTDKKHNFAIEQIQVKLLQIYHLLPLASISYPKLEYKFSEMSPEWGSLYFQAYKFLIMYSNSDSNEETICLEHVINLWVWLVTPYTDISQDLSLDECKLRYIIVSKLFQDALAR